jgi:UDP-N-acetylglucosamine 2-epimerase (non-hydrolysing)
MHKKLPTNIYVIIGTKAQLIKMAPVMRQLQINNINYKFIFTGQHKETINKLLNIFSIKKPDIVLYEGKDVTRIIGMLRWFIFSLYKGLKNKNLFENRNGFVLVHGDAISALLGAILAKLKKQKVITVEAGLRSNNIFDPFPEEITRRLVSTLTDVHFCPNEQSFRNSAIFKGKKIKTYRNTLFDSLNLAKQNIKDINLKIPQCKYCIVSIHRFKNIFNERKLNFLVDLLIEISKDIKVLFILHKPTFIKLQQHQLYKKLEVSSDIELRPRYDYFKFIKLIINSEFVITDGGSNQEECAYLGKPCLLMRNSTERKEGLGNNVILSKFSKIRINKFLKHYTDMKKPLQSIKKSPSKIITNYLKNKVKC